MGCNRRQFLFFGDPPPPQCGALNQRIAAMQANLGRLQGAVQASGNEDRRRMLSAQYDAYCRQQVAGRGNFFEQLFGGPMREVPIGPDPDAPRDEEPVETGPRRGSMAVCVRKCDGGYFPVSYSAHRGNLDDLADLCTALCPNAETVLFTKRPDAEIEHAVSFDGESYDNLANAGKFKKRFDPACTCKPKNRSWAEALADAEKLIAKNRRDLIVTPEKAEELSRPKPTPVCRAGGPAAGPRRQSLRRPKSAENENRPPRWSVKARRKQKKPRAPTPAITPGRHTAGRLYTVRDGQREVRHPARRRKAHHQGGGAEDVNY